MSVKLANNEYLTVKQATELIPVTEKQLRHYIARKMMPVYRVGLGQRSSVRLKREDILNLLSYTPVAEAHRPMIAREV